MPFLLLRRFLSEEEQSFLYQKVITEASGKEVTIRTLDFGGDKYFEDGERQKEKNPFLGYRSIRVFLRKRSECPEPNPFPFDFDRTNFPALRTTRKVNSSLILIFSHVLTDHKKFNLFHRSFILTLFSRSLFTYHPSLLF